MSLARRGDHLERELSRSDGVVVTTAADFLHGGEPAFARMFDRKGALLGAIQGPQGEPWAAFRARAKAGRPARPPTCAPCSLAGFLTPSMVMMMIAFVST